MPRTKTNTDRHRKPRLTAATRTKLVLIQGLSTLVPVYESGIDFFSFSFLNHDINNASIYGIVLEKLNSIRVLLFSFITEKRKKIILIQKNIYSLIFALLFINSEIKIIYEKMRKKILHTYIISTFFISLSLREGLFKKISE